MQKLRNKTQVKQFRLVIGKFRFKNEPKTEIFVNLNIICCKDSKPFLSAEIIGEEFFFLPNIKMYIALANLT